MAGLLLAFQVHAQNIFSIEDIIHRAKEQSPFSKQAETQKETSYWQYRYYRTNYNPQLRLNGNLPSYYNNITAVRLMVPVYISPSIKPTPT
jgi:hypothetical protein